jgi:hypothetical protein
LTCLSIEQTFEICRAKMSPPGGPLPKNISADPGGLDLSQTEDTCDSADTDTVCACRALVDAMTAESGVVAGAPVEGDWSRVRS